MQSGPYTPSFKRLPLLTLLQICITVRAVSREVDQRKPYFQFENYQKGVRPKQKCWAAAKE